MSPYLFVFFVFLVFFVFFIDLHFGIITSFLCEIIITIGNLSSKNFGVACLCTNFQHLIDIANGKVLAIDLAGVLIIMIHVHSDGIFLAWNQ